MNENDFSAAFDAEDAFASRMDYMRRRRRRRRRRSRKGRRGESAKAESFRTSTNLLCPRWDPENNTELEVSSGSRSRFEAFARSANVSLKKSVNSKCLLFCFMYYGVKALRVLLSAQISSFCSFSQNARKKTLQNLRWLQL